MADKTPEVLERIISILRKANEMLLRENDRLQASLEQLAQEPPWVPAIVTSGLLTSGTWICIDDDGSYWVSSNKPAWDEVAECWHNSVRFLSIAETPQITGEQAVWQVP